MSEHLTPQHLTKIIIFVGTVGLITPWLFLGILQNVTGFCGTYAKENNREVRKVAPFGLCEYKTIDNTWHLAL